MTDLSAAAAKLQQCHDVRGEDVLKLAEKIDAQHGELLRAVEAQATQAGKDDEIVLAAELERLRTEPQADFLKLRYFAVELLRRVILDADGRFVPRDPDAKDDARTGDSRSRRTMLKEVLAAWRSALPKAIRKQPAPWVSLSHENHIARVHLGASPSLAEVRIRDARIALGAKILLQVERHGVGAGAGQAWALAKWRGHAAPEAWARELERRVLASTPHVERDLRNAGVFWRLSQAKEALDGLEARAARRQDFVDTVARQAAAAQQQVQGAIAHRQQERADVDAGLPGLRKSEQHLRSEVAAQREEILTRAQPSVETLEARYQVLATVETVQLVVQDSVVLWRALAALESKKVDKAELDALRLEAAGRAEVSRGRAADARRQLSDRVRLDVEARTPDWEAVEEDLRSHADQFTQFQDMMKVLAKFVEDLVERIAHLRGIDVEAAARGDHILGTGEQDVAGLNMSASGPVGDWSPGHLGRTSASTRPQSAGARAPWNAPNAKPPVKKAVRAPCPCRCS